MRLPCCGKRMPPLQKRLMSSVHRRRIFAEGRSDEIRITPMSTQTNTPKIDAKDALTLLEQAWAYYTPEPVVAEDQREPDLFEYANAA
jgi:hypothetical protein